MATSNYEQPRNLTSHIDIREINKLFNKKNETPDGEVGKDMNANLIVICAAVHNKTYISRMVPDETSHSIVESCCPICDKCELNYNRD